MTADDIAIAVVTACKATGADPYAVVRGEDDGFRGPMADYPIGRARCYAAFALHKVFQNDYPLALYAKLLGVKPASQSVYVAGLKLKRRLTSWWQDEIVEKVVAAIHTGVVPGEMPKVLAWEQRQQRRLDDRRARRRAHPDYYRRRRDSATAGLESKDQEAVTRRGPDCPPPLPQVQVIQVVETVLKEKGTISDLERRLREAVPASPKQLNLRKTAVLGRNVTAEVVGGK
jgi:hypothetical protein